ncbi:hypothetical protein [Frigoriglobus tundricola]|nr:hypothetical protein [Frigoriglobus tundricola]
MPGSKRGLTLPTGWRDRPGPVFVVEGPTDAAALTAAGLAAVGRPSNAGGGSCSPHCSATSTPTATF